MEIVDDSGTVALGMKDNDDVAATAAASSLGLSLASGIAAMLLWRSGVPMGTRTLSVGSSLLVGRQGSEIAVTEFIVVVGFGRLLTFYFSHSPLILNFDSGVFEFQL
jgi:hypothetical protein